MAKKWYVLKGNYEKPSMRMPREIEESSVNMDYWIEVPGPPAEEVVSEPKAKKAPKKKAPTKKGKTTKKKK